MDAALVDDLFNKVSSKKGYELSIDLNAQKVTTEDGSEISFDIDGFRKHCLLNGLDDIGLTLNHADDIRRYETQRKQTAPWLF